MQERVQNMTTLSEWDEQIAPYLHALEDGARKLAHDAILLRTIATKLMVRPSWNTKAEDELDHVITRLRGLNQTIEDTINKLIKILEVYEGKPVEK